MKIDKNTYGISATELIAMLQTLPENVFVCGSIDRVYIAQPNEQDGLNWKLVTSIVLDHDQPYFWSNDEPSTLRETLK